LPNVQLFADAAIYDVQVTDLIGTATSQPAVLNVRVSPFLITPGGTNFILQGGSTIFYINAGPVHRFLPLTYRYVPNPANVGTFTNITTTFYTNSFFILSNVVANGRVNVVIQNPIGNLNITTVAAGAPSIVMIPDNDRDGIADAWETNYGFSSTNATDALADPDNDGMNNRGEYVSGTNPTNAASVLKLTFTPTQNAQFTAESNVTYNIQLTTNVIGGWETISNIAPVGTQRTIDVAAPSTNSQRFIRVIVP
jgi:hypothetical protein